MINRRPYVAESAINPGTAVVQGSADNTVKAPGADGAGALRGNRRGSPPPEGRPQEVGPVEAGAWQRHEDLAWADGAGVGGDPRERGVARRPGQGRGRGYPRGLQGPPDGEPQGGHPVTRAPRRPRRAVRARAHRLFPSALRASRTTSRSSNRLFSRPTIW
jgi:hypothetical protein